MEYKLIKKFLPELKFEPTQGLSVHWIRANDLEAELAKGINVVGLKESDVNCYVFSGKLNDNHPNTHSGLLIGYKPIESSKPVTKEEINTFLHHNPRLSGSEIYNILKRISENGVK